MITQKPRQIESKFKKRIQNNPCSYISREPQYCAIFGRFLTDILKLYSIISKNSLLADNAQYQCFQ